MFSNFVALVPQFLPSGDVPDPGLLDVYINEMILVLNIASVICIILLPAFVYFLSKIGKKINHEQSPYVFNHQNAGSDL